MAPLSRPEFKQQIQQMDSRQFEFFIADIWAARGWETQVTEQSGDGGIDVEVTRDSDRRDRSRVDRVVAAFDFVNKVS